MEISAGIPSRKPSEIIINVLAASILRVIPETYIYANLLKSYAKDDTLNILMKFLIVMNSDFDGKSGGMENFRDMGHIIVMFDPFGYSQNIMYRK